ncbi:type VI secretion system baseplate subunit TssF [Arcobacter sp. F2176]|uniref:type VI secretion system baseplate subunit TssF n=1 Tax=Arcobacter sp. F2176 TaxID=2044511 RepID=UPI00100A41C7|nr:type VI secretion system baseplate subunit TssF [Arcobacter sp. F2176]RXJ82685.1 type VI secretion system baseplate subunit TssF [Arcobacter sp. F2176]
MAFNDYYKEELIKLRNDGAEFSKKNPGLSTYLSKEGQDPDVERLLEGFSFLTGRLKQNLNEELPEVAHTLVQLLWPNYVKPIPSYSIIQYDAIKDSTENVQIKKNTEVLSKLNSSKTQCKFRTIYDIDVMPFMLKNINYFIHGKKSTLELNMNMTASGTLKDLIFKDLRIYLSGSKFIAQNLYLFLTKFIERIEISINNVDNKSIYNINIDNNSIVPVSFDLKNNMTPYSSNLFDGYILLQEYFSYKDKFLFLDFRNLSQIENIPTEILENSKNFTIKIEFKESLSRSEIPDKSNFSLYCTPIINLFETDSIPIRKNEEIEEFLVVPSDLNKDACEVFSIQNVRGWISNKKTYQDYLPFESFEHIDEENEYYSSRVKLTSDGKRTNTYLRFSTAQGRENSFLTSNSTISVKILCTNLNIPSSLLLGDICVPSASSSNSLAFKNITIPTISYPPPIKGDFLWKIISNMSLNYLSLKDIKALRTILETHDFFGAFDVKQKDKTNMILKGIESISFDTAELINKGLPIRGMNINLIIEPSNFSCIGEAYLFCCVLNEFFSLYGNINSFHRLTVNMKNEYLIEWVPRMGSLTLI